MSYTKEDFIKLGLLDIKDARSKTVDISIFDNIDDLKLSDKLRKYLDLTKDIYIDYLDELEKYIEKDLEIILKALMNTEVIDNHSLERENIDLLHEYSETHHSTAIRYLIKKLKVENQPIDSQIIKKAQEILMRGTSNNSEINNGFRTNNNHFVGYFENNEKVVSFLPISYDDINIAIKLLCDFFNQKDKEEDLFIKPFIIHGLIGALQVFEDGNTRMARTIQHIALQKTTNNTLGYNFNLPPIYFSKNYIPYRYEYRELIAKIATNPDNETWNEWIMFNLKKLQDRIYKNETSLLLLERKRK